MSVHPVAGNDGASSGFALVSDVRAVMAGRSHLRYQNAYEFLAA
ncbi:MAG TPA: hypothetical protein VLY20_06060 [Nitrospiria bacterium]|nr:hypothetical protein [Nitrospiria bacterium]